MHLYILRVRESKMVLGNYNKYSYQIIGRFGNYGQQEYLRWLPRLLPGSQTGDTCVEIRISTTQLQVTPTFILINNNNIIIVINYNNIVRYLVF